MSDPPKSAPFSFNTHATSGTSNIFGQPSSSTSATTSSLFGQSSGAPVSSNPSPFSNIPPASSTPSFGVFGSGITTGNNSFGNGDKSSSSGFSFGPTPASNTLGKSFDTDKAGPAINQPSNSNAPSSVFTTLSTPNKPSESTVPSQTQATALFGGAKSTGEVNIFGSANTTLGSSGQAETSTPTSKPSASFSFGTSTTPAGPPPTNSIGTGANPGSIFGLNKSQETQGSIFQSANTTQSILPPANAFGGFGMSAKDSGGMFGLKPAESSTPGSTPQTSSSLFGKNATNTTTSIFSKSGESSQPGAGILGTPKESKPDGLAITKLSSNPLDAGVQSQTAPTKPNPFFSGAGSQSLAGSQSTQASASSQASIPAPSFFSALAHKRDGLGASSSPMGSSIFSSPKQAVPSTTSSTNEPTVKPGTSGQSTSSGPTSMSNLFGTSAPSTASQATTQAATTEAATTQAATTSTLNNAGCTNANLGTSTAGPTPPVQSRLKNKTMDEIITRWASDLSKYQKDFQGQAETVASWDRMLVENSDKIQRLYGSTLEAERATTEVERQLTAVENDQAELAIWLEHYEKEVNQMMSNNISQGDSQGPDQERERAYKLADKLSERLEEMGKDLTGMITEINDASSKLGRNSKADDSLSQVVRVLNSHLAQLQEIDQGAAALQAKVAAAQKAGQSIGPSNGLVGPSSYAADGFYRSYMGRR